jgi:UPF0755 protein
VTVSDVAGRVADPKRFSPRSPRAALEPERVPEPKRASKRARHPVVVAGSALFTIILMVSLVAALALSWGRQRFDTAGPLDRERVVNITRGAGLRDIADLLQREGVIDQPWVFIGGVLALKAKDELKSGEYLFQRQASLRDVVDTIIEGKVVQHQLTVPEGLTSEQVVARLMENDILSGNIREIPKEGTLLPESYRFTRGTTREQLIQRLQQAQRRAVQEAWERRNPDLPIKTPEQLVVLASIIEKETGKPEERSRVAAVFANRLKQRMKLQSDPTIIYGLVGGKGSLGHPLTRAEVDQPTPYNTYTIEGLPPGPIANPGRASLEAAANPARTKELFFVADGTGGHSFSENLDQHNKNVGRLRQLEQQQREAGREGPPEASTAFAPPGGAAAPAATSTATQQPRAAQPQPASAAAPRAAPPPPKRTPAPSAPPAPAAPRADQGATGNRAGTPATPVPRTQ